MTQNEMLETKIDLNSLSVRELMDLYLQYRGHEGLEHASIIAKALLDRELIHGQVIDQDSFAGEDLYDRILGLTPTYPKGAEDYLATLSFTELKKIYYRVTDDKQRRALGVDEDELCLWVKDAEQYLKDLVDDKQLPLDEEA